MIALIDYGMGNLRSVEKALVRVGGDVRIVSDRKSVLSANAVVLPGVGAFGDCMKHLQQLDLVEPIREFTKSGKPFLGICLGLQSLFDSSEEATGVAGLKVFKGDVPRFHANGLKVPHMGWNQISIKKSDCPLLSGVANSSYVYFVHSYYPKPVEKSIVCATTNYGVKFCSMVWRDNLFATQFHPEKSQAVGLKMLENFVKLSKK